MQRSPRESVTMASALREALDRLLRDVTLVTLALAIAIGWSLFQVAAGFGELVSTLLVDYPDTAEITAAQLSEPLTWDVGGRILTLGPLLRGTVELAVALFIALLIRRQTIRSA
jgi:hypothetical protein